MGERNWHGAKLHVNNSEAKSNTSLAILRDGQVSSNKPEWMNHPWSEKRPAITRPRQPSIREKVKVATDSSSMKVEQNVCKNVSFSDSGRWDIQIFIDKISNPVII